MLVTYRRRKARQNVKAFDALIASPAVDDFAMPAGGKIRLIADAGSADGATAATLTGPTNRTIKTPLLTAGQDVVIDWVERAVNVDPSAGFTVQVDTGLGNWRTIANGA